MDNVVTSPQLMDLETFKSEMDTKGWVIFNEVLEDSFREELIKAQDIATEECRQIQIKNGVVNRTAGTSHHLVVFEGPFMKFVEEMPLHDYMTVYFDNGPYILNSFGGVMNFKAETSSYVGNVHRDIRTWSSDLPLMLNMLVMLDDFTPENGATWFMSGSHKYAEKPTDEEFFAVAEQAVAKKGSIVLFNSNVWHAAGTNQTDQIRRGLTPMFTKPFFKPQFDYSRYFGYDRVEHFSPMAKQLLGYNSRVPANLDEWYQVPEKRLYIPGQG